MDSERPEQFVYDGHEGQTRRETVHAPLPSGGVSTVRVYRAVNVATDPRLRAAALDGTLNRDKDNNEIAVSFVYHDPKDYRFVLVVSVAMAHQLLLERAALLQRLADDVKHRVPPYVARADAVVGPGGLAAYLALPDPSTSSQLRSKLAEVETRRAQLVEREKELKERERRLKSRAEKITTKEDEVRLTSERLEVTRRELELRERELDTRFEKLRERERALSEAPRTPIAAQDTAASVVLAEVAPVEDLADSVRLVDDGDSGSVTATADVGDDELDDASIIDQEGLSEAIETGVRQAPSFAAENEADPDDVVEADMVSREVDLVEEFDEIEEIEDEEFVDDSDVEVLDDSLEEVRTNSGPEPLAPSEPRAPSEPPPVPSEPPPALRKRIDDATIPPDSFFDDPHIQMVAAKRDGVWLFGRMAEHHEDAFREDVELLVQYLTVDDVPVVLLTLVEWVEPRPIVLRAAVDPRSDEGRELLDELKIEMKAKVALFNPVGRYERTIQVEAPERLANLEVMLNRAARAEGTVDSATALERALAAPPPVKLRGHPFAREVSTPQSAREALQQVSTLAKWCAPAKLDLAVLGLSIPRGQVDRAFESILGHALEFGIALPEPLISRAVSLGVAAEPGELISKLCESFREVASSSERGGLSPDAVSRNWDQLLACADRYEVSIDAQTHEQAQKDRQSAGGEQKPTEINVDALGETSDAELMELLEHPSLRRHAAAEVLTRGDSDHLGAISKAIRKMPRDEVIELMPRLVGFGEVAADALIDALGARKTFVRQAAALALGELKLRRSISPLVQLLQTEPTEVWWEIGRVLSTFGGSAIRPLSRAMKDPKGTEDRFAYALAHLLCTSAAANAEKLVTDENSTVQGIAETALTLREVAQGHRGAALGEVDVPDDDVIHSFSRRFYEVLGALEQPA